MPHWITGFFAYLHYSLTDRRPRNPWHHLKWAFCETYLDYHDDINAISFYQRHNCGE